MRNDDADETTLSLSRARVPVNSRYDVSLQMQFIDSTILWRN